LGRYSTAGAGPGLPQPIAVDEATVEASPQALPRFLRSLPRPLGFPVAIDKSGRVADGYRVQDSPWLELVSGSGRVLFYYDVAAEGWPTLHQLLTKVPAAVARAKA
ncbi:MAG TPA: hypothetical protein VJ814_00490, partial [Gaiellaceae bacterium]|nr:hypothetical protein [Gaiellaceae bacterium]